jgi:NhaP-type Na+/H+ and K+/H+ antiporter
VFFLVLVSVLVQGTSITWVARWLRVLQAPAPESAPATAASSSSPQEAAAE